MITRRAKAGAAALGFAFALSTMSPVQAADPAPAYPSLPKTVTCSAGTNATKSVLKVKVAPKRSGKKTYTFTVQKLNKNGTWSKVRTYKTKSKKSINLKKGTYRVSCKGAGAYSGAVSPPAALRK
jgi:hypothetical protein